MPFAHRRAVVRASVGEYATAFGRGIQNLVQTNGCGRPKHSDSLNFDFENAVF